MKKFHSAKTDDACVFDSVIICFRAIFYQKRAVDAVNCPLPPFLKKFGMPHVPANKLCEEHTEEKEKDFGEALLIAHRRMHEVGGKRKRIYNSPAEIITKEKESKLFHVISYWWNEYYLSSL